MAGIMFYAPLTLSCTTKNIRIQLSTGECGGISAQNNQFVKHNTLIQSVIIHQTDDSLLTHVHIANVNVNLGTQRPQ